MYKVFPVAGGFQIFWCPSAPTHYDDRVPYSPRVYPHRPNADRRCRQLKAMLNEVDAMIARDGAIIL